MMKSLLTCLTLLFSLCVQADVYKCVDEKGRTMYQAGGCVGVRLFIDETPPSVAPQRFTPLEEHPPSLGVSAFISHHHSVRSEAKKNLFKSLNPCPSTGEDAGPCPGYVVDHIKPLACGGADDSRNMQWQTVAEGKAKDRWERIGCQSQAYAGRSRWPTASRTQYGSATSGKIYTGPRGGKYTLSPSGRKHYLSRWADGGE
jgi:hypothetical protein